jgi:hypothetical protein
LDDPARVLAFLRLMLSEPMDGEHEGAVPAYLPLDGTDPANGLAWVANAEPLLEALVRTLEADPRRLDAVARIVSDLEATEEGRARIPAAFLEIWSPVWEARERTRQPQ